MFTQINNLGVREVDILPLILVLDEVFLLPSKSTILSVIPDCI